MMIRRTGQTWRPDLEELERADLEGLAKDVGAELRRRNLRLSENQEAQLQEWEAGLLRAHDRLKGTIEREQDYQVAELQATLWAERANALAKDQPVPPPSPVMSLVNRLRVIMKDAPPTAVGGIITLLVAPDGSLLSSNSAWRTSETKQPQVLPQGLASPIAIKEGYSTRSDWEDEMDL